LIIYAPYVLKVHHSKLFSLKTIIIDDEQDSRESLRSYLTRYCPAVVLVDECPDIETAQKSIQKHHPQLIFLDIEMPFGNAFDLLERIDNINFEIIFVTAFSQYAVQAFNLSAAHYLLKPVDIEEIENAVAKVSERISEKTKTNHTQVLLENLKVLKNQNQKLVLPLLDGLEVVRMSDILHCEAEDNFTNFYFKDGKKAMICRGLKHYETLLEEFGFCRVHRSSIVNLEYVKRYIKGKGGSVILENGKEIMVSNNRKAELMRRIGKG
jgi:two-component system LytT family response regulator